MAETSTAKRQMPECPFGAGEIESAKAVYLEDPHWKNVYANAPSGAKRRLEAAFWFSQTRGDWPRDKAGEILSACCGRDIPRAEALESEANEIESIPRTWT